MKQMFTIAAGIVFTCIVSCKKNEEEPPLPAPETWQEHWYEHDQLAKRVYYDKSVVVYYDDDVDASVKWPFDYIKKVWDYSKATYGNLSGNSNDDRLYAIFHAGKYSYSHPSYYYDASHDNRNVIDCASPDPKGWISGTGNDLDVVAHEVGHIVESTTYNTKGSPAFVIWGDSKWAEIYIYDLYKGLNREEDVKRWYDLMMNNSDDFPVTGTQWFKNWFYPIYTKYGGKIVLAKFFQLLAEYFPKDGEGRYTRNLNWGEFVHFWSGAAGANLKSQATIAFGWPTDWEEQFIQARKDFPALKY